MEDLVRKVKDLKNQTYNRFTAEKIIESLERTPEFSETLFVVINLLDKEQTTESLFATENPTLDTKEGFIHLFLRTLMAKEGADYSGLASLLTKSKMTLSFAKLSMGILALSKLSFKNHPSTFAQVTKELLFLSDTFYRLIFEMFYHNSKELSETEQQVLLRSGYLRVSGAVIQFLKENKKSLDSSLSQHQVLSISDFIAFDGDNLERYNTVPTSAINHLEFLKFVGHLTARMDFIRFFVEKDEKQDLHEILQFKDIRAGLKNYEEKIAHDAMAVIESEAGYFEYKKYRTLSLRKDKIFNLHKNIVTNTDQPDEHLNPTNDVFEGYGGFYPIYLVRQYLVKDRSCCAMFTPVKLVKLILHVLCCVPENSYTGGEYYLRILSFLQGKLEKFGFEPLENLNQSNIFWYDTFVALKRIDFNIKPKNRSHVIQFFNFLMSKISVRHTRYIICTKLLDMDYVETFFQTNSMSTAVLQVIHDEVEEAKYHAFDHAEIFLRKELIEKVHGHLIKGDHKQIGMLRTGRLISFRSWILYFDFRNTEDLQCR